MGTNPGFDAPKTAGILSRLPEITIPVVKLDFLTGKLIFQDQNGTAIDRKDLTVTLADSAGNGIAVAEDGTFKAYAEEYFYTVSGAGVEYATGSVTMKEEGSNEFTITRRQPQRAHGTARRRPNRRPTKTAFTRSAPARSWHGSSRRARTRTFPAF